MIFKRPQKAPTKSITLDQIQYPMYASFKLDGIRGVTLDGQMHSNTLTLTPSAYAQGIARACARSVYTVDGELIPRPYHIDLDDYASRHAAEGQIYREAMSVVQTQGDMRPLTFFVFDLFTGTPLPYRERLRILREMVDGIPDVVVIEQRLVNSDEELLAFEKEALDRGYEGLMLRTDYGVYKSGPRCTLREYNIFKFVRHVEFQARVLDVYERMHNGNEADADNFGLTKRSSHQANKVGLDTLGGFKMVHLTSGVEFDCGNGEGLDAPLRQRYWTKPPIGQVMRIRAKPFPDGEAPRQPIWIGEEPDA